MTRRGLDHILVYGGGLAGAMSTAALRAKLPESVKITWLQEADDASQKHDIFYGSVSSPSSYDFLRGFDLLEPELLMSSDTAFSFGTHYQNWGPAARSWIQSFHIPLPLYGGVGFHHYVMQQKLSAGHVLTDNPLEPYIMPAAAAYKGVFAHPPEGRKIPLASAEYGYHFSADSLVKLIRAKLETPGITHINNDIAQIKTSGEGGAQTIAAIALQNGKSLSADLYIDCSGPAAKLMTALPAAAAAPLNAPPSNAPPRRLKAAARFETQAKLGPPRRRLIAHNFGWQSETPLQGRQQHLIIYDPASQAAALEALGGAPSESAEIEIKRLDTPWRGNCAAIGQSAAAIEPLTPAPMMMLQADISRLLELIPVGEDMTIERREYNRRFRGDHGHAALFGAAFFAANAKAGPRASGNLDLGSPYWRAAKAYYARADADGKLRAKLTQFKSRGALVTYDCEPFSPQDWVMLYFGLGHDPARYDPLADRMPSAQVEATLARMKMAIAQMAEKMPPHHVYMTNLLRYLKEQT